MVVTRGIIKRVEEEVAANEIVQRTLSLAPPAFTHHFFHQRAICSREWPIQLPRQRPCTRSQSTALIKKENHDRKIANSSHDGVQSFEGQHNGDIELYQDLDYIQLEYPPIVASLEAADRKLLGTGEGFKPIKERNNVSNVLEDGAHTPEDSNATQSTSLNLSDMLTMGEDFSSIDSKPDASMTVGGYIVRQDLTPILVSILEKYGDIADQCKKSCSFRSMLLEKVCNIVQKLQVTEFVYLTTAELDSFRILLEDIESDGLNVGWLLQRLDEICEAKRLLKDSPKVKQWRWQSQKAAEIKQKEIRKCEEKIRKLQEKINSAKHEMELKKKDKRKLDDVLSYTKVQLKRFHCGQMTDGLL